MNSNFNQKVLGIIIIVLIIVLGLGFYYINSFGSNTVTVYEAVVEDKITKSGIVTAYQTPIKATSEGEVLFYKEEESLVRPYTKVASLYSGEINEEAKEKLEKLNDKIVFSEANKGTNTNITGDIASINREINKEISEIISETNDNNFSDVYKLKKNIYELNLKSMELKGLKVENVVKENIEEEIRLIEKELNFSKKDYTSPVNGMFSTKVSNYDDIINPDIALSLTPKKFKEIYNVDFEYKNKIKNGESFCKIINNYEWYLAFEINKNELKNLDVGSNVNIRIMSNSDATVPAEIVYISDYEKDKAVAVIKSTEYVKGIWTAGKIEFELIKRTKSGLKLPTTSVFKKDGKTGVYAVKDSVYKFIEVKILLENKNYILIENNEDGMNSSNVILYDFVVINPKNVSEGDFAT